MGNGIPFLRQRALWNPQATLNAQLEHLHIEALDIVDVVVSKLKRLSPSDDDHIEAMIAKDFVSHIALVACFREAVDDWLYDARAGDLPKYVANLNRIERDVHGVAPTEIELPEWVQ